jgi:hypothetical protein
MFHTPSSVPQLAPTVIVIVKVGMDPCFVGGTQICYFEKIIVFVVVVVISCTTGTLLRVGLAYQLRTID